MSVIEKIELKPIGFVKTKAVGKEIRDKSNVSEIVLREGLTEALEGLLGNGMLQGFRPPQPTYSHKFHQHSSGRWKQRRSR